MITGMQQLETKDSAKTADKTSSKQSAYYYVPDIKPSDDGELVSHLISKVIARFAHGIEHVMRVALGIPVFYNLFRRFRDPAFENCTQRHVKLTQIAALFHDACRKNEKPDDTDRESALLCYLYFRLDLKLSHEEAKYYAEGAANKDSEKSFFELHIPEPDNIEKLSQILAELIKRNRLYDKDGKHYFQPCDITVDSPLADHASLQFKRIYQFRYAEDYLSHLRKEDNKSDRQKEEERDADKPLTDKEFDPNDFWKATRPRPKNAVQMTVHDSDCCDILRARDDFIAEHLDFVKRILNKYKHKNPELYKKAYAEFTQLLADWKSMIHEEGDSFSATLEQVKLRYEREGSFSAMEDVLNQAHHLALRFLYNNGELLELSDLDKEFLLNLMFDPEHELDELNVTAARQHGKFLMRAVVVPSSEAAVEDKDSASEGKETKKMTFAEVEIEKTYSAEGNEFRSTSLGGPPFAAAGYFVILRSEKDEAAIQRVELKDSHTGRGNKEDTINEPGTYLTKHEREEKVADLQDKQRMGRQVRLNNDDNGFQSHHNELLYHVKRFDGVFYSADPNLGNKFTNKYISDISDKSKHYAFHVLSPVLQAIYLQKLHANLPPPHGKKLPLFEISGYRNIMQQKEFTDDQIIEMWVKMCESFIQRVLRGEMSEKYDIANLSLDDLKTLSMYGTFANYPHGTRNAPADSSYEKELQQKLNDALTKKRAELLEPHKKAMIEILKDPKTVITDQKVYSYLMCNLELLNIPEVRAKIDPLFESAALEKLEAHSSSSKIGVLDILCQESLTFEQYKNHAQYRHKFYSGQQHELEKRYELALIMNNKVAQGIIRKRVLERINQLLKKDDIIKKNMMYVVIMLVQFGCYEEFKPLLLKKIATAVSELHQEAKDEKDLIEYTEFVEQLHQLKRFDRDLDVEQFIAEADKLAQEHQHYFFQKEESLSLNFGLRELFPYLQFMKSIPYSMEQCQEFLIRFFKNFKGPIDSEYLLSRLAAYADQPELFELMVQKIEAIDERYTSSVKHCDHFYKLHCKFLDTMSRGLPTKTFKPWQLVIVERSKQKCVKDLLAKQLNALHPFKNNPKIVGELPSYLYLAKKAQCDSREIIAVVIKWLQTVAEPFSNNGYLKEIIAQLKPFLENTEIFALLVQNISVQNEKNALDFAAFRERIEVVKGALPGKTFNPQQQLILAKRLKDYEQQMDAEVVKSDLWHNYVNFIKYGKENHMLDKETLDLAVVRAQECAKKLEQKDCKVELLDYLELAHAADIPLATRRSVLHTYLKVNPVNFHDEKVIVYLRESGLLDEELFILIAERIKGEPVAIDTIDKVLDKYEAYLKNLELIIPKTKELTDTEQKGLEKLKVQQARVYMENIEQLMFTAEGYKVVPPLIMAYLELANTAQIPVEAQKEKLIAWLNQQTEKAKDTLNGMYARKDFCSPVFNIYELLIVSIRPFLQDDAVFAAFINNLSYCKRKGTKARKYQTIDFYHFYSLLEILKSFCPGQCFTEQQQAIIKAKIQQIKQEVYQKALAENNWHDFALLIRNLKQLNLPHEDVIALAQERLLDFTKDLESKEGKTKLVSYVLLAEQLEIKPEKYKAVILNYFQDSQRVITCNDRDLILVLAKSKWIHDPQIFTCIVEHLRPLPFDIKKITHYSSPDYGFTIEFTNYYELVDLINDSFRTDESKYVSKNSMLPEQKDLLYKKCLPEQARLQIKELAQQLEGYKNSDEDPMLGLRRYFSMSRQAEHTKEEQKQFVITWLKKAKEPLKDDSNLRSLLNKLRDYQVCDFLNDRELFTALIEKLDLYNQHLVLDPDRFKIQLNIVKSYLPGGNLTEEQTQIVTSYLEKMRAQEKMKSQTSDEKGVAKEAKASEPLPQDWRKWSNNFIHTLRLADMPSASQAKGHEPKQSDVVTQRLHGVNFHIKQSML